MTKYLQSQADLQDHLKDTIQALEISAEAYDDGREGEAKRLALAIRVLVHNTNSSKSLLGLLGMKSVKFYDTSIPDQPGNLMTYAGITAMLIGGGTARYVAPLDQLPPQEPPSWVDFGEWWNRIIFSDVGKRETTRRALILAVANKDGGAHVDPKLDEKYAELSRRNSLGWRYAGPRGDLPMEGPELAAIRQITHEVLKSLNPTMPHLEPEVEEGFALATGAVAKIAPTTTPKVGRNQPCPCGSGKKHKHCHLGQR